MYAIADNSGPERELSTLVARVSAGVRQSLERGGLFHQREMARSASVRTGALRRSFGYAVEGQGLASVLRVFSQGLPYAAIQEFGGTIRPKNKRFLTIPLPDAKTPAGALKGGARLVQRGSKYFTADGDPTFIFRSKRGNLLIGAEAKNGRRRLLYTLKPSVTLKARLGFNRTFQERTAPFILGEIERSLPFASASLGQSGGAA